MYSKQALRRELKKQRQLLTSAQVNELSQQIIHNLVDFVDWEKIKTIHIYQTLNNEVDTMQIVDYLRKFWPQTKIHFALSMNATTGTVPIDQYYDLIIVPLTGFDRTGQRIGYGGGYYDKFLANNKYSQVIGLAYSFQEVAKIPIETHDQKLDIVITEKEIIKVS